jgi:hypothetical protein
MEAKDPYRRRINNDMIDKFYITTYARKDAQITWNNLTNNWKSRTHLVVQDREKEMYSEYPRVIVLPKEIQTLSPTREWLIRNSRGYRFSIFDDDLEFYKSKASDDEGPSNTIMKEEDFIALEKEIDDWFDEGNIHCGLGSVVNPPRSNKYDENSRICMNVFYDGPNVPVDKVHWSRLICSQDFDCNLQLLRQGHKNRVFNRYRVGQKATATSGGCQSYRTIELHNQCMQQLSDYHNDFVTLRTKVETGTGEWKGLEKFAATILWKKAYESSKLSSLSDFF